MILVQCPEHSKNQDSFLIVLTGSKLEKMENIKNFITAADEEVGSPGHMIRMGQVTSFYDTHDIVMRGIEGLRPGDVRCIAFEYERDDRAILGYRAWYWVNIEILHTSEGEVIELARYDRESGMATRTCLVRAVPIWNSASYEVTSPDEVTTEFELAGALTGYRMSPKGHVGYAECECSAIKNLFAKLHEGDNREEEWEE